MNLESQLILLLNCYSSSGGPPPEIRRNEIVVGKLEIGDTAPGQPYGPEIE